MTMTTMTTTMTTTSEGPNAAETAAKEIAARGEAPARRGRPPGSKTRKASAKKAKAEPQGPTPEEIQGYAFIGGTIWKFGARIFKLEDLSEEEELRLGAAMAPVAAKYLPMLDEYAPEAALVTVVIGLVMEKRKKPVEDKPDLELVGGGGGQDNEE